MDVADMAATFVPFATYCDTSFWSKVNKKKLNEWMLDESPKPVWATPSIHDSVGSNCRLSLNYESFKQKKGSYNGDFILFNTVENFKKADKTQLLKDYSYQIWNNIINEKWLENPEVLNPFFVVGFADLKKFEYVHWTCVPAICYPNSIGQKISKFDGNIDEIRNFFQTSNQLLFLYEEGKCYPIKTLKNYTKLNNLYIVVADPSPIATSFGWTIRNILAAISFLFPQCSTGRFVSLKGIDQWNTFEYTWDIDKDQGKYLKECPKSVGWERNSQDKLLPYRVNLSTQFDPKKLMEQSVDLNLSLIKWRVAPNIKLERYSNLKALIFGAGTLGCNIARCLMGWGVRTISFVDNSTVSYSNPVRQSLAEFADAKESRGKAETAAEALKRIFPSVEANAYRMTVPMPGHTIEASQESKLAEDVNTLEKLIESHDALFLALDSREARWLPTLLANKYRKITISVALGFDTYVIIRHGIGFGEPNDDQLPSEIITNKEVPYSKLSCYFCSDVTAPGNSTADRTLDQQCTVSRPGLSMIASGVAVELLSSILQHKEPLEAPAMIGEVDDTASILGAVPHQIRGFISRFQQMTLCVKRFNLCVACGSAVKEQFEQNGWKFVRNVMNSPSHLETVTGLDQLQHSVNDIHIDFDDSDSTASL